MNARALQVAYIHINPSFQLGIHCIRRVKLGDKLILEAIVHVYTDSQVKAEKMLHFQHEELDCYDFFIDFEDTLKKLYTDK